MSKKPMKWVAGKVYHIVDGIFELTDLEWKEVTGPYTYVRIKGVIEQSSLDREGLLTETDRDKLTSIEPSEELMNKLDSCAMATGVDRDTVKKVLDWYQFDERTVVGHALMQVERFNREVIGLPVPENGPQPLSKDRAEHAYQHLLEELNEFREGWNRGDMAMTIDALVDLVYVALGRLIEMGILPMAAFEEVHEANMKKVRGTVSKRPQSLGYDAVKPDGWLPPNQEFILSASFDDLKALHAMPKVFKEIAAVRLQKGDDYNRVPGGRMAYFPFQSASFAHMTHTKAMRITSIVSKLRSGGKPNFEGLRDSLVDLINYSCFFIEWLDNDEKGIQS